MSATYQPHILCCRRLLDAKKLDVPMCSYYYLIEVRNIISKGQNYTEIVYFYYDLLYLTKTAAVTNSANSDRN